MVIDDGRTGVKHPTPHVSTTVPETLLDEEIEEWDRRLLVEGRCQMFYRLRYRESRLPRICTAEGALVHDTLIIGQRCNIGRESWERTY
jgi:hypothetical protein